MTADRTMTLSRYFDCAPEVLFRAWTDPAVLPRWFGPKGYTCETSEIDIRPGGQWLFTMVGMGMTFANRHRFLAIDPPGRIEFLMDDGTEGYHPNHVTVTFSAEGAGARLVQVMVFPDAEARAAAASYNAEAMGQTTLDKLAAEVGVA